MSTLMWVVQTPIQMHRFGGRHKLTGTVETLDGPVGRRVHCFAEDDNKPGNLKITRLWPVGMVDSDPSTGAYEIQYLSPSRRYTLLSFDPTGTYDPVVVGGKIPEPM